MPKHPVIVYDEDMNDSQACCAHCRVVYKRIDHIDGTCSDSWVCDSGCGAKFIPINNNVVMTGPGYTPNHKLPPIGNNKRRKILIEIEVTDDFEKRLDNQWMIEQEIHADRYSWNWKLEQLNQIPTNSTYTCWICKKEQEEPPAYTSHAINGNFHYCNECWNRPVLSPPTIEQSPYQDRPPGMPIGMWMELNKKKS